MENLPPDFFLKQDQFTKTTHRDLYPAVDPSSPSLNLAGKVVVITGASKGLGHRAFVRSFTRASPRALVLAARDERQLDAVAKEIHNEHPDIEVSVVGTSVSNSESVARLWEHIRVRFGHAHVLVSNAGINAGNALVIDADVAEWWSNFEVNTKGFMSMAQHFLRLLPSSATNASIINITATLAFHVVPALSQYAISKLAAIQLVAYLAAENPNVQVVALHPGIVPSDMVWESAKHMALDTPELCGGVAVWLTSPAARFLSGRFVSANWSVEDLVARKADILKEDKLKIMLRGELGSEQFEGL